MATYKVIQDIEAEDKLLGPLSLRQFIYAVIVVVLGFIMFTLGKVNPVLVIPFLPPTILFGFLAAPFGHDQSSEVWLLAKIRFILKPRGRVWNQAGLQELVTITAPKKIERILTNGLDQYQVQSRLQALASTIDTRGWAIKGVDVNMLAMAMPQATSSDRLVGVQDFVSDVPDYDVTPQDDILDADNNRVAHQVDQLIQASSTAHRQALMDRMAHGGAQTQQTPIAAAQQQSTPPTAPQTPMYVTPAMGYTTQASSTPTSTPAFLSSPQPTPQAPAVSATSVPTADEAALLEQIHEQEEREASALKRMHSLPDIQNTSSAANQTASTKSSAQPASQVKAEASSVTQTPDAGILKLANNDDLTVATIARQAHKQDPPANNEVVISLH